jgi:hypothetical protein
MAASIAANGGRSCINASAVLHAEERRQDRRGAGQEAGDPVQALPADDPNAQIAGVRQPGDGRADERRRRGRARRPGAEDVTQRVRGTPRLVRTGRLAWLLPTIIRCDREHPLATEGVPVPVRRVVECPQAEIPEAIGTTLVGTVVSRDRKFIRACMSAGHIDRLNVGPIETFKLSWDQPHEGNLFELLYRQRAFQIDVPEPEAMAAFP